MSSRLANSWQETLEVKVWTIKIEFMNIVDRAIGRTSAMWTLTYAVLYTCPLLCLVVRAHDINPDFKKKLNHDVDGRRMSAMSVKDWAKGVPP